MDVEELLRLLKPVLGDRSIALWREYQLNPSGRREIEGMLRLLASQHLGLDFESRSALLPPPESGAVDGEFGLGDVIYGSTVAGRFGLRSDEMIQHIAIFGRTGSGKTNVGLRLIGQLLERQIPFLVFDWKRNYRDVLNWPKANSIRLFTAGRGVAPFRFNPLLPPPGTTPSVWLKKLIEIQMHVYYLGEGVAYLLQNAIDDVYEQCGLYTGAPSRVPTLRDVHALLVARKTKGREAQWMESTLRVLGTLCYGDIDKVLNSADPTPMDQLLATPAILELDALTNADKTFLVEAMMLWIHHFRLQEPTREQFKHALIIEEAHHILLRRHESKESLPEIILREIRELGEAVVIIDQHPSMISIPALGNTYCTVAMNLKHARDVSTVGDAMLLDQGGRDAIGRLPVGTAIVRLQGRHPHPFVVRFPLVEIVKGSVTDFHVSKRFVSDSTRSEQFLAPLEAPAQIPRIPAADKVEVRSEQELGEAEVRMLEDVMSDGLSGVRARFARLSVGAGLGERLLVGLEAGAYLSSAAVPLAKGRVRVLQLTEKGAAALRARGHAVDISRRGGPEHEYWKGRVATHLRSHGWSVTAESSCDGGYIDIVATRNGRRLAVEVETGASDVVANAEKCLAAGVDDVICFVTRRSRRNGVVRKLGALLATGRVRVMDPSEERWDTQGL